MSKFRDRRDRSSRRDRGSKSSFKYKRRSSKTVQKRASQRAGNFESPFNTTYPMFSPESGDNMIRLLPPTWENAEHYGFDVYVHYGLGDRGTFLCPKQMRNKRCPACEEYERANREGEDEDYVKSLKATKRVAVLIIDRNKEKKGPMLWSMPWTVDRDIAMVSEDKKTKEVLTLDDPEEGYDVSFVKEGKEKLTKYTGVAVDRRPSPLSDDDERMQEWLDMIQEHPITECLVKHTASDISKALSGKRGAGDDEDEEKEPIGRHRGKSRDEDDDEPRRRKDREPDDDDDEIDDDDESLDSYDDKPRKKKSKLKREKLKVRSSKKRRHDRD